MATIFSGGVLVYPNTGNFRTFRDIFAVGGKAYKLEGVGSVGELKVQMLGGFALRMNGQELLDTDTRSKKAWILLAYLICQREYTVSQKKLIDLLWGEEPNSVNPENALRKSEAKRS